MIKTLEGIKIVDFTLAGAGPACTKLLTEYGAKDILVEPLAGNSTRTILEFDFYTAGKRCITLDLKAPEGMEAMHRLVREADVFVTNYRTKAVKKLGLDYETLRQINPRLIYAALTGFGDEGPVAQNPGYDTVCFWARGGMMRDIAEKGSLIVPPVAVGDAATGQGLAGAICAALFHRERTGQGMKVSISILSEAVFLNHDALIELQHGEQYPKTRKAPRRALLNTYRCKDDRWIVVADFDFDRHFWNLLRAVGRADLAGDPRWTCIEDTMYEKAPALIEILDEAFSKMTQNQAFAALESVDVAVERVQATEDLINDPQCIANGYVYNYTGAQGVQTVFPTSPAQFGDREFSDVQYRPGPQLGEHSIEVLKEYGYTDAEIKKMLEKGITSVACGGAP